MPFGFVNTLAHMEELIADLLGRQAKGTDIPFAITLSGAAGAQPNLHRNDPLHGD